MGNSLIASSAVAIVAAINTVHCLRAFWDCRMQSAAHDALGHMLCHLQEIPGWTIACYNLKIYRYSFTIYLHYQHCRQVIQGFVFC